ncbi:MAG: prepilin-type N-terminal cleavage/methylation domain-containing protein [Patescibacteria group bacterium]
MKFHNISVLKNDHTKQRRGFTLIEVLISLSILTILLGLSVPFVLNFYERYQIDSERAKFVSLLRQARTMSLGGEGSADHGMYISGTQFTVYEGANYATRNTAKDQTSERETNVDITGPTEATFAYLTGTTASQSFILDNRVKQNTIHVNTEGTIDWQ